MRKNNFEKGFWTGTGIATAGAVGLGAYKLVKWGWKKAQPKIKGYTEDLKKKFKKADESAEEIIEEIKEEITTSDKD